MKHKNLTIFKSDSVKKIKVIVDELKCVNCGFCRTVNKCFSPQECIGCLSCYHACPYEARRIIYEEVEPKKVKIIVDGVSYEVPKGISVAKALEYIGFKWGKPGSKKPSLPCRTGGCWSCALIVNGEYTRTCITPVRDGMEIETNVEEVEPLRIVHGPEPHLVGGKATPWYEVNGKSYVEAAIWVAGCNLRCPQCQNYSVTYDNTSKPLTPKEAARMLTTCRIMYNTKGVAISGGEPTLNRRWLIEFFKELNRLNPRKVRKHLDSNATLLTPDYIDELVEAGCNNIGVEPKALRLETYMEITGIKDRDLASKYLETAWKALEYIVERYRDKVYVGVGIAYNKAWMTFDEVAEIGDKIANIDPKVQVTVLDYFPTFRRRDIKRPKVSEMLRVKKILEERGLKTVIVQTSIGHIGP